MKKLFIILSAATLCTSATAQLEKGRMMLGGSFNFQNDQNSRQDTGNGFTNTSEYISRTLSASLRYGYFVSNRFMVGILGGYSDNTNEIKAKYVSNYPGGSTMENSSKSNSSGFSGGAFTRYYTMIGNSRFAWFGELSAAYGHLKNNGTSKNNGIPNPPAASGKTLNMSVNIRPGITYFFNKTIAAEASFGNVGYLYRKTTTENTALNQESTSTTSGISSNLNFSLSNIALGINFYFGG